MNVYPNIRERRLHYIGFNPGKNEIFTGTDDGFQVFQCSPFQSIEKNDIRGIGVVAQIGENENKQYALVAGGSKPAFVSNTRVNLFGKGKWIRELTFSSQILNLVSVGSFFAIVLEESITIYCVVKEGIEKVGQIKTAPNLDGICDLVTLPSVQSIRIAYPFKDRGKLVVQTISIRNRNQHGSKKQILSASKTAIRTCTFNRSGTMIATASVTGTLVRVFSLTKPTDQPPSHAQKSEVGQQLFEFRRGSTRAIIYSLCFSKNEKYLCTTSSSGTLHVFSMVDGGSDYLISTFFSYHMSIGRHKNEELIDTPHIAKFIDEDDLKSSRKRKVKKEEEEEEEREGEGEGDDESSKNEKDTTIGILTACGNFITLKFDFLQNNESGQSYISPSAIDKKKIIDDQN